jgi:hypothetical protein
MRKIQILGAFIAVLAFSMLAVASASATLWLIASKSLTAETAANSHGLIILEHKGGLIGNFKVHCTGLFLGTVGPGALDLVTGVEGLKKETGKVSCEFSEGGGCGTTGALVLVTALNLPWHTLLVLSGSSTLDHFLSETGKIPGYEVPCGALKGNCSGLELTLFTSNGANGAIFEFNKLVEASCTDGGKGTVTGKGELLGATVS